MIVATLNAVHDSKQLARDPESIERHCCYTLKWADFFPKYILQTICAEKHLQKNVFYILIKKKRRYIK